MPMVCHRDGKVTLTDGEELEYPHLIHKGVIELHKSFKVDILMNCFVYLWQQMHLLT